MKGFTQRASADCLQLPSAPSSGLLGNSVSKSGHCQPRSITTTDPIDASVECVGLFLRGGGGAEAVRAAAQLCERMYSVQSHFAEGRVRHMSTSVGLRDILGELRTPPRQRLRLQI